MTTVLGKEDRSFWQENGYVVVHNAVPQNNLNAMVAAIWQFLQMDPEDEEQWYKYKPYTKDDRCSPISAGGMVEIYMSPAPAEGGIGREERIRCWQERCLAANWPGDARGWEHVHQKPAVLTELGRKLLGVDSWN